MTHPDTPRPLMSETVKPLTANDKLRERLATLSVIDPQWAEIVTQAAQAITDLEAKLAEAEEQVTYYAANPPSSGPSDGALYAHVSAMDAVKAERAAIALAEKAERDLAQSREWRPMESAPKDENVLVATTGEWVGEARLDYHPHNDNWNWVWAGGSPIHPDLKLLGWRHLPEPPPTTGSAP